jgi:hypothetical protein
VGSWSLHGGGHNGHSGHVLFRCFRSLNILVSLDVHAFGIEMDRSPKKLVQVWMPGPLSDAIEAAASKHFQSKAEWIRQTGLEKLKSEGVDVFEKASLAQV